MIENKYKVLVVDDIEDNLQSVANVLSEKNTEFILVRNGRDAIKIAQNEYPDLILLDISMPDIDGFETCKILKSDDLTNSIPVIFLSSLSDKDNIVQGFELGGVNYVTKPFHTEELLSRVFTHLELKKAKDIIRKQKEDIEIHRNKIERQHSDILSSIQYAKFIQEAILPSKKILSQFLPSNFVLYLPKDIISGDFYWTTQMNNKIIFVAADCTGHGVPGAFMSMLGIAFLSDIMNKYKSSVEIQAGIVLDQLRKRIKLAMHQENRRNAMSNGMDLALCVIDIDTKKMNFAGANIPLYLVRYDSETSVNQLHIYEPDKMPISIHIFEKHFKNSEIQLISNDIIYLFSDGYQDQFGGEKNTKFQKKQLKNLLVEISNKPMDEQGVILLSEFEKWKGTNIQTDDVLLIGIKILENYGDVNFFEE